MKEESEELLEELAHTATAKAIFDERCFVFVKRLRELDVAWATIAAQMGETGSAVRRRYNRRGIM